MAWVQIGLRLVPHIFSAVMAIEKFVTTRKGPEKEDAAVDMVTELVRATEAGVDKDLLNDADVQQATRATMQAIVRLQNVIRDKQRLAGDAQTAQP